MNVEEGDLLYEVTGHIARITFNRPAAHNALTSEAVRRLALFSEMADRDDDVRVVLLTGAGADAFCVGGDLDELIPRLTGGHLEDVIPDPAKRFFSDLFKPVVAAVNGHCIAGGLEILLGTDIRIAADTATFGLAEVRWGLIPGAGSHVRLPAQVPWPIAMQMLLTGESISAQRAYEVGLVNEIVPRDDVGRRAQEVAEAIARNAPLAVRTAKEIAVRALGQERGFTLEWALNDRVLRSDDAREGPRAFLERRPPEFRGR